MIQRKWRLMILVAVFTAVVPLQGCVVVVTERPSPSPRPWPTTVLDDGPLVIDVRDPADRRWGGR